MVNGFVSQELRSSKSYTPEKKEKKDLNLAVYNYIKEGIFPAKICELLNMKKTALQYYLNYLKLNGFIDKIGYSVWEVKKEYTLKEVQKTRKIKAWVAKEGELISSNNTFSSAFFRRKLEKLGFGKCLFCGHEYYEIHHLIGKDKGGLDKLDNLIPVCPNHHAEIHVKGLNSEFIEIIKKFHASFESKMTFTSDFVRGHAFTFVLKLPKLDGWMARADVLKNNNIDFGCLTTFGGGQKLVFRGRKVWLLNKSIVVYEKASFLADSARDSRSRAVFEFLGLVRGLESLLGARFDVRGQYKFKVARSHYALVKNALAKQYDEEGKKLSVYSGDGLWFVIDNSFNLHEAETLHAKTGVSDNEKVQSFFNGLKAVEGFTPEFVLKALGGVIEQQNLFGENMVSHVAAVQALARGVDELTKVVKELRK